MQFLVLGPLEVLANGRVVALPAPKHRALLTALVIRANQAVAADSLIDALWAGRPPASAAKTLQTYVSQLRRELEPDADGTWHTLQTVEGGYRLHVDPESLDADRFERLAADGRQALNQTEAASAAACLREGLALWRGPAYGELSDAPFVRAEATRLEELRLAALEWRAEAELALGGHAELIGELEQLVAHEPFRERLWGHLMLALYRSGRQAEALNAYRRLRGNLADQLGIDPSPELRRLEERILRQDPSLNLAAPSASSRDHWSRLPPVFATAAKAPLVGRDCELGRLRRAWEEAKAAGPQLVVVSGEPGIGKTRLAAELARLVLADGGEVLVGHADEEPIAPYQPFIEALGQYGGLAGTAARLPEALRSKLAVLLPAIGAAVPLRSEGGELDRFHLLAAVARLLVAMSRASPVLLVLEDLHWADQATLTMLAHLARTSEHAALLVLVTARDGGLGVHRPWIEILDELRRHRLAEIVTVQALDERAVRGLVCGYLGHSPPARLVATIGRTTDRNPFFLEELLHHLVETGAIDPGTGHWPAATAVEGLGIPEGVLQLLARRLARLSDPATELLQVAAVLGREFDFTLLNHMTGWDDAAVIEAVEEALQAGVLTERGSSWVASYAFRHALVREALYAGLSLMRRQILHLRAAVAIQATGPLAAAGVAAAARHLCLAGPLADQAQVAEQSVQASEAAVAVYAWHEAVTHLRAAFAALQRSAAPLAEQARIAERISVLVHKAGTDLEEGISRLEWALAAYQAAGDRQAAARIHSRLGMHLTTYPATLNVAAGLEHYQAAEADLAGQPVTRQLGYLYIGMAMAAVFGVRTDQLEVASRQALEVAAKLADEPLAGWASYQRAWRAFNAGRLAESLSLHERMYDIAARLDDVAMASWAAFGRAILSGMYLADPLTAHTWCSRGLALQQLDALPRQRDGLLDHMGQAKGSSGQVKQARRIAEDLDAGTVLERMLLYWSGDWEQAEQAWTAARDRDARCGDHLDRTLNSYWLGRVRRLLAAYEAAEAALAEGLTVAVQGPQVPAEVMLRAELALLAADRGRRGTAEAELARCQEIVRAGEDWRGLAGRVALAAGVVAAANGKPAQAGEQFATAVATFRAYASTWDEAETRCLWARALPAQAGRQRSIAADLYRRIGAGPRWAAWAAEPAR